MKKVALVALAVTLMLSIVACENSASGSSWQGKYDLGVRYLEEGNYEEAIIAFTAAIEIDPARTAAYIQRGNAYLGAKDDASARADFQKSTEIDASLAEAWIGLAGIVYRTEGVEAAIKVLKSAGENVTDNIGNIEDTLNRYTNELVEELLRQADELIENGEYDEAKELLVEHEDDAKDDKRIEETLYEVESRISWDKEGLTVIKVSNTDELTEALEKYNHDSVMLLEPSGTFIGYYDKDDPVVTRHSGFEFRDLNNVIIWGDGETEFLCENLYVPVIDMRNCNNVTLHGVIVGHQPPAGGDSVFDCIPGGDVISVSSETEGVKISIEGCDLFGCGFCGIDVYKNVELQMRETTIHDCSMMIALVYGKAFFEGCSFINNAYDYPELHDEYPEIIERSVPYAISTGESPLIFNSCVFENNLHPHLMSPDAQCEFNGCSFSGNAWE